MLFMIFEYDNHEAHGRHCSGEKLMMLCAKIVEIGQWF